MTAQIFNYASKARRFLETDLIRIYERAEHRADADAARFVCSLIDRAVHFHLPDCGRILDDGLQCLWGEGIRLPYPIVTVEYRAPGEVLPGAVAVPERLVVACETTLDDLPWSPAEHVASSLWSDDRRCILAIPLSGHGHDQWTIDPVALALPMAPVVALESAEEGSYETMPAYMHHEPGKVGCVISAAGLIAQPDALAMLARQHGERPYREIKADSVMEASAVLGMVEALTCSNVTSEVVQTADAALNARRIKKGKLPLYETRTLVVTTGHGSAHGTIDAGGHHRSPRQHLRRGHVRRLSDGRRVWVTACVVGNAVAGTIDKKYAVLPAGSFR